MDLGRRFRQRLLQELDDQQRLNLLSRVSARIAARASRMRLFEVALHGMLAAMDAHKEVIEDTISRGFLEEYLSVDQASQYLGLTGVEVCELIVRGQLPAYRLHFPTGQVSMPLRIRRADLSGLLTAEPLYPPDLDASTLYYFSRPSPLRRPPPLGWLLYTLGIVGLVVAVYLAAPAALTFAILSTAVAIVLLGVYLAMLVFLLRLDYNTGGNSTIFWMRLLGSEPVSVLLHLTTTTVLLSLIVFASAYRSIDLALADSFSEPLSRMDALYFSVTTFSTTGFGDIHPLSATARAVCSGQMALTFLLVSVVIAMIVRRITTPGSERFVSQGRQGS